MPTIEQMTFLAEQLIKADKKKDDAEKVLKEMKESARILREVTIPNVMQEANMKSFKLTDGKEITIRQEVYASIPKANIDEALDWLDKNGFGGLIKVEVKASYGKGDKEDAVSLYQELQEKGLSVVLKEDVHSSTLKAFLKEQIAEGNAIPLDLFGARPVLIAKIK